MHQVSTETESLAAFLPPPADADSEVESESAVFGGLLADSPPPAIADSEVESESAVFGGGLPPANADTLGKLLSEISESSGDSYKNLELKIFP